MVTEPTNTPDIIDRLGIIANCRRCKCRSCQDGYENHSHRCTQGPHCVETQERLKALLCSHAIIAADAREALRQFRTKVEKLRARLAQLEAIHHG
jgi:hypothetical protein